MIIKVLSTVSTKLSTYCHFSFENLLMSLLPYCISHLYISKWNQIFKNLPRPMVMPLFTAGYASLQQQQNFNGRCLIVKVSA